MAYRLRFTASENPLRLTAIIFEITNRLIRYTESIITFEVGGRTNIGFWRIEKGDFFCHDGLAAHDKFDRLK